jgi:hypothetical protein
MKFQDKNTWYDFEFGLNDCLAKCHPLKETSTNWFSNFRCPSLLR